MSAKEEIRRLVDVLSDFECQHLLNTMRNTAAGQRFWEEDVGILYNEYAKTRYSSTTANFSNVVPTKPAIEEEEEGLFLPVPIVKPYIDADRVELPASRRLSAPMTETMLGRRSRRDYTGETISRDQLSTLLQHACGTTGFLAGYDYSSLPLRSFPSAGGLQAPEVYLSVHAVDDMPAGLYHYHPIDHVLESLKPGDHRAMLSTLALGQPYVETAAVVFLISGYYERLRWKYGERAYRYVCMDTGFLGQNLCLVAEALKLGACAIAGFIDDAVEGFLGIDGQDEIAMLLVSVGVLPTVQEDSSRVEIPTTH